MNAPDDETAEGIDQFFLDIDAYRNRAQTLRARIEEFRHVLTVRPLQSVDLYEECILDCVRLGWDREAYACAKDLADYIKASSRYAKLAVQWALRNRSDICTILLSKHLTDFFCDFPLCGALLDYSRIMRFRYTLWEQGQVYAFGDNRNRLLGVKGDIIPRDKPVEVKFPTTFQLAAMGSSTLHTVFQGVSGDFYGCGAARNFMVTPKSDNEIIAEPTKIIIKFEPTDPVKNFYVSDSGTLIFTDKYVYVIGKKVDPKKTGKKWVWPWPEKWFTNCGKGAVLSKNMMRFTVDQEKFDRPEFTMAMPLNGAYLNKDNYAIVDFRGKPIKVFLNNKNCYYSFEDDSQRYILNYVVTGKEHKMGVGPDLVYPNGLCVTMAPGATIHMGRLQWAKKANCTDESDVKQHTLLAYLDEIRGAMFMERFVATPDDRGFIYQIGRPEKRPYFTLKPSIQEARRITLWSMYVEYIANQTASLQTVTWSAVHTILDKMYNYINPEWMEKRITKEMRHIHMIGFLAYALTDRTRLIKCHSSCPSPCWLHPLPQSATSCDFEFRETYQMPQLFDFDRDRCEYDDVFYPEILKERLRTLMNTYDDNSYRFSPIYESTDTRVICEAAQFFNKQEINFCREKGFVPDITNLRGSVLMRCLRKHILNIRTQLHWLEECQFLFTEEENKSHLKILFNLVAVTNTWLMEVTMIGNPGRGAFQQNRIPVHYQTRNPQMIVLRKVRAGLLDPETVKLDLNIRFSYRVKTTGCGTTKIEEQHAKMGIQTNAVMLSMMNPKLVDYIKNNVLNLNLLLDSFQSVWTVTMEYPLTVFFFLQQYRQSPITITDVEVPHRQLLQYGFKLILEKHAANCSRDCPDRMFGITWHYANLKYMYERKDADVIAPTDLFGDEHIWELQCRDKLLKAHKDLLLIYSRHSEFMNREKWTTKRFEVDENYDVVLPALRLLSDVTTIEKHTWPKRLAICRFLHRYKFPEALDDVLACIVLFMKEVDVPHIRELINEFPIIMSHHIAVLRPTIVLTWPDDVFPEPKIVHLARISENWPERMHTDERITKSHMDPTFSRLLRTDEQWKRAFFSDANDNSCDIEQMLNEDMFTKLHFDRSAKPDIDEV